MRPYPVLILISLSLALSAAAPARAQDDVQIVSQVTYTFAQEITFKASIVSGSPVESAVLLFGARGQPQTLSAQAEVLDGSRLQYTHSLGERDLRAFSTIEYRYHLIFEDGATLTTRKFSFQYEDNRFTWDLLEEEPFRVHWYDGDIAFAQAILDVAQEGLVRSQELLAVSPPETIDLYVYASPQELQPVLPVTTGYVVAGHADITQNTAVVAISTGPEQRLIMEQSVPHEIMHILLFDLTGPTNTAVPVWFSEGLASAAELYPNPDYQVMLDTYYVRGQLLPIESLCQSFPKDISNRLLAYAQSASFTRYLHQTYGVSGLNALVESYSDRMECSRGFQAALGQPLTRVESDWRAATFHENPYGTALKNLLPWIILLAAVLGAPLLATVVLWRRPAAASYQNNSFEIGD